MVKTIAADFANVRSACIDIEQMLRQWNIQDVIISDIVLSIDEAMTNILIHGYSMHPDTRNDISFEVFRNHSGITILISDGGRSYAIEEIPNPEITSYMEKNIVGGFGLHLIRNLMDTVKLVRIRNRNYLWLFKSVPMCESSQGELRLFSNTKMDVSLENRIVISRVRKGSRIDATDAHTKTEKYGKFLADYPELKAKGAMINIKNISEITEDARKYFSQNNPFQVSAVALVVNSMVSRWIANVFIFINKIPERPIRLFGTEKKAIAWLAMKTGDANSSNNNHPPGKSDSHLQKYKNCY